MKNLNLKYDVLNENILKHTLNKLNKFFNSPLADVLFTDENIIKPTLNPIIKLSSEKLKELNNKLLEYCKKSGFKNITNKFIYNYFLNHDYFYNCNELITQNEKNAEKSEIFLPKYPIITIDDIQNFFEGKKHFLQSIINGICEQLKSKKIFNSYELYLIEVIKQYKQNELLYFGIDNYNQFINYALEYINEIKKKILNEITKREQFGIKNTLDNRITDYFFCKSAEDKKIISKHCLKIQLERFNPIIKNLDLETINNIQNTILTGNIIFYEFDIDKLNDYIISTIFIFKPDINFNLINSYDDFIIDRDNLIKIQDIQPNNNENYILYCNLALNAYNRANEYINNNQRNIFKNDNEKNDYTLYKYYTNLSLRDYQTFINKSNQQKENLLLNKATQNIQQLTENFQQQNIESEKLLNQIIKNITNGNLTLLTIINRIIENIQFPLNTNNLEPMADCEPVKEPIKEKINKQFEIEIKSKTKEKFIIAVWYNDNYFDNIEINRKNYKNNLICDFLVFLSERMNLNIKINQFNRYNEIIQEYKGISGFLTKDFLPLIQKKCNIEKIPLEFIKRGTRGNTIFLFEVKTFNKNKPIF